MFAKASKRLGIVVACLLITACSTFSLVFSNLERLVTWRFDSMFDLSGSQEDLVWEGTAETKQWLLDTGFPKLVSDLKSALTIWESEELHDGAYAFQAAIETGSDSLLKQMGIAFTPFALSLENHNADAYRAYIKENRDDWFAYAESDRSKWLKRREVFEDWFGELERWQLNGLRKFFTLYRNEKLIRERNTDAWVERFLEAALNDDEKALQAWMARPRIWWTSSYAKLNEHNQQQIEDALSWLLISLNKEQQASAADMVEGWIDELDSLIND